MSTPEVTVIDYGVGNLLSVQRALEHCGAKVILTAEPEQILAAGRVLLPGVGAFDNGMQALERLGLVSVIHQLALQKTPLLGICLGMQLLLEESEEYGLTPGLGLIPGRVIPIPNTSTEGRFQKIPHVGWNALVMPTIDATWNGTILQTVVPGDAVYFVHSFMAQPKNDLHLVANCSYGGVPIPAVLVNGNVSGCQFHPEKSGEVGLRILREFITQ